MYHLHTLKHMSYFPIRWGLSRLTVTRWVSHVEQELLTLQAPSTKSSGIQTLIYIVECYEVLAKE